MINGVLDCYEKHHLNNALVSRFTAYFNREMALYAVGSVYRKHENIRSFLKRKFMQDKTPQ